MVTGLLGSFTYDGHWSPQGYGSATVTREINKLVQLRRDTMMTPREIALRIGANTALAKAFDQARLAEWLELREFTDWPFAGAGRSSEIAVKQEGRGGEPCEWQGGHLVPKAPAAAVQDDQYESE